MKLSSSIKFLLFVCSSLAFAGDPSSQKTNELPTKTKQNEKEQLSNCYPDFCFLEGRAAYFYPTGETFRSFYPGGVIWGLEFDCKIAKYLYGWAAAEYFTKDGHTDLKYSTNLVMVPLSVGLKFLYTSYWLQPYFGVGVETIYLREKVKSPFLIHSIANWDLGFRFKTGFFIRFYDHFFIDLYTDYSLVYARLHNPSHPSVSTQNPTISNLSFGGGLGIVF